MRLLLAYHAGGRLGGLVHLLQELSRRVSVRVAAVPLELVETVLGPGDIVYALLLFRSTHYAKLAADVGKLGAKLLGLIPLQLTVRVVLQAAARLRECPYIMVSTHGWASAEAHRLAELLTGLLGKSVYLSHGDKPCTVKLAAASTIGCRSQGCVEAVVAEIAAPELADDIARRLSGLQ